MNWRTCIVFALLSCRAMAGADEDWQEIVALDAGPKAQWKTRAEARDATLAHFERQEKALRDFVANYPADPRKTDAELRLVHLLATRGDLRGNAKGRAEAMLLLDRLAREAPPERIADVDFARLSLFMRSSDPADEKARETLLNKAFAFRKSHPDDRRIAALFAEVATLFDSQPRRKSELLEIARAAVTDPELRQRIEDDRNRLALLGKPLALKFTSTRGEKIDVEKWRGKVVLIYFFADWSPASMAALDLVRDLAVIYSPAQVRVLGISLDENSATLETGLRKRKIDWPIFCDGKGWQGPLVRSLGINSLPTLWILDRAGRLRTLNARDEAEALIAQFLRERE